MPHKSRCGSRHPRCDFAGEVNEGRTYRNFSEYIDLPITEKCEKNEKNEKDAGKPCGLKEHIYFPTTNPLEESKMKIGIIDEDVKLDGVFRIRKDDKPFTFSHHLSALPQIEFGTVDKCYLIRYKNPWDFHLILDNGPYLLDTPNWHEKFPSEMVASFDAMCFKNGLGLHRTMTCLLSIYMRNRKASEDVYKTGDLVVCTVPRFLPSSESQEMKTFGYRAVVIQDNSLLCMLPNYAEKKTSMNEASTVDATSSKGNYMKRYSVLTVYLLDTGEKRVIQTGAGFLAPLPKVFLGIPPLAIHCGLHGVSSAGPDWSASVSQKVKDLIIPPEQSVPHFVNLTADFFSTARPVTQLTDLLLAQPQYFVELSTCLEGVPEKLYPCYNVSTAVIKANLALEWNLFPGRPAISKEHFLKMHWKDPTKTHEEVDGQMVKEVEDFGKFVDEKDKAGELKKKLDGYYEPHERGLILHMQGRQANPRTVPKLDKKQLGREMKSAFINKFRNLDRQIIKLADEFEEDEEEILGHNVLAIRVRFRQKKVRKAQAPNKIVDQERDLVQTEKPGERKNPEQKENPRKKKNHKQNVGQWRSPGQKKKR